MKKKLEYNKKTRKILSILFNIAIIILEIIAAILSFKKNNISMFMFYTEDSNLFAMIVSIIMVIVTMISIKKQNDVPKWAQILKYMSTCCLSITFLVVILILVPMIGKDGLKIMLFENSMLYHHLLCPWLSIISFVFFEVTPPMNYKHTILAMIPTCLYAIVTITLNILKIITGPYPFLMVYNQPIYMSIVWTVVILVGSYMISLLLRQASKLKHKID